LVVSAWARGMSIQLSIVVGAGVLMAGTATWLLRSTARRLGLPRAKTALGALPLLLPPADTPSSRFLWLGPVTRKIAEWSDHGAILLGIP
jgi:hypothetical protein